MRVVTHLDHHVGNRKFGVSNGSYTENASVVDLDWKCIVDCVRPSIPASTIRRKIQFWLVVQRVANTMPRIVIKLAMKIM